MYELEQLRKQKITPLIITGIICVLVFLFSLPFGFMATPIILVLDLVVYVIVYSFIKKSYSKQVKEKILVEELRKEFDNVSYDCDHGFSREQLADTELMSMGNRFSSNDYISGYYKGVSFEQSDVLIQQHTQSGKSSHTVTLFQGRWIVYSFNKRFTGYLQVRSNENRVFRNGKPVRFFSDRPDTRKIQLESEEFNQAFNIYASDEHEAYYILTPHFMEKMLSLVRETEGNVVFGFIDQQLHVTIYNNKDAFEPALFSPLDETYIQEIHQDIQLIKSIVDELAIDHDIYS